MTVYVPAIHKSPFLGRKSLVLSDKEVEVKDIGSTVQAVGNWLARKWEELEQRYGRRTALTMAIGMIATMPLPGNIPTIIAIAEGIRGLSGVKGQWVTMPANGEGGGGTHVYLDDAGNIEKGPSGTVGKKPDELKKKPKKTEQPKVKPSHLKKPEAAKPSAPKAEETPKTKPEKPKEDSGGEAARSRIREAKVKTSKQLSGSANDVKMVDFEDGTKGIFKSAEGENKDIDAPPRMYAREAASSELADVLGLSDMVPATVVREVGGKEGSCQEFVKDAEVAADVYDKGDTNRDIYGSNESLAKASAFDFLIGNQDRHLGNWLVKPDGGIVLIDNGFSFTEDKSGIGGGIHTKMIRRAKDRKLPIPEAFKKVKWEQIEPVMKKYGLSQGEMGQVKNRLALFQKEDVNTFADLNEWDRFGGHMW